MIVVNGIADYTHGQVIRTKIWYIQWKGKPQSTRLLQLLHTTLWSASTVNLRFMKRFKKEVRTSSYRACICGLHLDSPVLCKWCTVSISTLARFPNSKCSKHQTCLREVFRTFFSFCTKGNKVTRILTIAAPVFCSCSKCHSAAHNMPMTVKLRVHALKSF